MEFCCDPLGIVESSSAVRRLIANWNWNESWTRRFALVNSQWNINSYGSVNKDLHERGSSQEALVRSDCAHTNKNGSCCVVKLNTKLVADPAKTIDLSMYNISVPLPSHLYTTRAQLIRTSGYKGEIFVSYRIAHINKWYRRINGVNNHPMTANRLRESPVVL